MGQRGPRSAERARSAWRTPRRGGLAGVPRLPTRPALRGALACGALPYGYTLTLWGAGAMLTRWQGRPGVLEIFGFVFGALLAYATLVEVGQRGAEDAEVPASRDALIRIGSRQWVRIGLALVAATGLARVPGAGWPLCSFTVTASYFLAVARGVEA